MDTNKDKIIQDFLDHKENTIDIPESELKTYQFIYNALEKPVEKGFSLGFSKKIIRQIEAKQQRKFNIKMYSLLSVLLIFGLGFSTIFFSEDQVSILFSMFLKYKFIILFLLTIVSLIQLFSRLLIKKELKN